MCLLFVLPMVASSATNPHPHPQQSPPAQRRTQDSTCMEEMDCGLSGFCGTDGTCHAHSCQNWLNFGTWTKTSEVDVSYIPLDCEEYTSGEEDNYHAIVHACNGFAPDAAIPQGSGYSQPFNRKCTAPVGTQSFHCYDLDPETIDYSAFQYQVEATNNNSPQSCDRTQEQLEQGYNANQQYIYSAYVQETLPNAAPLFSDLGLPVSESFDPELAKLAMYATVQEAEPTPAPEPVADASQDDVSSAQSLGRTMVVGLSTSTLILAMVSFVL